MTTKLTNLTLGLLLSYSISAQAENLSVEELNRRAIERRALEAVIWGIPSVNYERMLQGTIDNGGKLNALNAAQRSWVHGV